MLGACAATSASQETVVNSDPWAYVPTHLIHTDHSSIVQGPFNSGQEVTQACLECHADSADQVMHTTHWTWEGEPVTVPWRDEPVTIGKKTQINNFCISSQGNEKQCMTCHAGYGWEDESFDFAEPTNVDCLACHADAAIYNKGDYGIPPESVDLLAAAKSVRAPTREECGKCHFDGGGGNGVKHGDLDESLYFPSENLDVHMGKLNFLCTDCHQTTDHVVQGKLLADNYTIDPAEQVACEDCHQGTVHSDERITLHTDSVACQTCHVPAMALKDPTKTFWDWSTAGQDLPEDHYTYLKIKGNFEYQKDVLPTYQWFNGNIAYRYLLGDPIDPSKTTDMVVTRRGHRRPQRQDLSLQDPHSQPALRHGQQHPDPAAHRRRRRLLDNLRLAVGPCFGRTGCRPGLLRRVRLHRDHDGLSDDAHGAAQRERLAVHRLSRRQWPPGLGGPGLPRRPDGMGQPRRNKTADRPAIRQLIVPPLRQFKS